MKCWKCQSEMINTIGGNYQCPNCDFAINDLVYRAPSENIFLQEDIISYQYGWICPKCGRVYSPETTMCSFCGNGSYTVTTTTTGTIGGSIADIDIRGNTITNETTSGVNTETNKPFKEAGMRAEYQAWIGDTEKLNEEFKKSIKGVK